MTVATTTSRVDVLGNGSATVFSFAPVVIFSAPDLQVTLRDSAGNETALVQGGGSTNYSVNVASYPGTGSITYPASGGSPLPSGSSLTIKRIVALLQSVALENQGAYFANVQEGAFDYAMAVDQQQQEQINRTVQVAATDPAVPITLPSSAVRANKLLGFDSAGNPIAALSGGTAIVSSAMQPVIDAASTSAAAALLGVPSAIASAVLPMLPAADTIAALRLVTTSTLPQAQCYVRGYWSTGDNGGGPFVVVASDTTSADNGVTIIRDASNRRWYRQCEGLGVINILQAGGALLAADNSAALQAAWSVLGLTGGKIEFPAGQWNFSSAVTINLPARKMSLTISGAGADATILHWPSGDGLIINCSSDGNSVHVHDLALTTAAVGSGNALTLSNSVQGGHFSVSSVRDVAIHGDDGGGVNKCWTTGINIIGMCGVTYDCVSIIGGNAATNGIAISGNVSGSFKYAIVHNITNCGLYNLSSGILYGTYVQGVSVSQTNITNGTTGIWIPSSSANAAQLSVVDCQLDCVGNGILVQAPMAALQVSNSLIYVSANGTGIGATSSGFGNSIVGNLFSGKTQTGTAGIAFSGTMSYTAITGNGFNGLGNGVILGASTANNNVQSNTYQGNVVTVANSGSNTVGGGSA